ncbi:MAG: uroporphyrinogen-III C-methyltransferase [Desulfobacteraceae bacterium]|nr:uroporphyrinogen-III C-methyltransferase [Desulfobacteraceae bacterium]
MPANSSRGIVYLVGAGPGDPGLITVKGAECIAKADVLIYDYLAAEAFLAHTRSDCERIYVGKKGGDHTLSQDGINQLIIEKAKNGNIVTRLKGGDPFIFGRGGEEAEVLVQADIDFEIVPGVTSAVAAPAYAGIPLTHRNFTSTVAFVTGHEDPTKPESGINWKALSQGIGTLVFFMGVKNLPHIVKQLLDNGRGPKTPAALVRWGTTARQVTVCGTLENIVQLAHDKGIKAPAIIVVGEVVTLRSSLEWFEKRPLLGKRIVVTRARAQASELVKKLTGLGAHCIEIPTIKVVAPQNLQPLDNAISALKDYDWIVFTSVNGVNFFFERLFGKKLDTRALGHLKTAAIGPATAKCMLSYGLNTDILPDSYRAESVVAVFEKQSISGKKVLLPRASQARPILPQELTRMGALVDEVSVYQTIQVKKGASLLAEQLAQGKVDMVTFTSSSTVRNYKALLPQDRACELIKAATVVSIGPITTETAESLGFQVALTADSFTIEGLCKAIVDYYQ